MRSDPRQERRLDVLKSLVRVFIAHGEPVGSKAIAGKPGCHVSAATVRHDLADLEEMGYLDQPHPSAGRVPTEKGYRLYVDLVLDEWRRRPTETEGPALAAELLSGAEGLPDVLVGASRALSRLCRCVGLALPPPLSQTRFRHARFLRIDRNRVVMLIVGEEGMVTDRVVHVEEDIPQEELDRISNYIVNRFQGSTLLEVQRVIERELSQERSSYDRALRHCLRVTLECLERSEKSGEVYVDGAARCLESLDFEDVARVRELLRAYEQKDRIARLLLRCLDREGVQIRIGAESGEGDVEGLPGLALVAAQYRDGERPLGSVGVLGPTRMEYERVIAVVDRVARDLSQALSAGFPVAH
jgi:heat-inducible transcriptional repressor